MTIPTAKNPLFNRVPFELTTAMLAIVNRARDLLAVTSGAAESGWWESEPAVGRVAHGVPKRVDRVRALGNAVVPACAREAFIRFSGLQGGGVR